MERLQAASPDRDKPTEQVESLDSLKAAAFSVFLATLPAHVEAAEFKDPSWLGGVKQLRQLSIQSKKEHAGISIGLPSATEKNFKWSLLKRGRDDEMYSSIADSKHRKADERVKIIQTALDSGKFTLEVCRGHTHLGHLMLKGYTFGPSDSDINYLMKYQAELAKKAPSLKVKVTGVAFEPIGVWYYTVPAGKTELLDSRPGKKDEEIGEAISKFHKNILGPNTSATEGAEGLREIIDTFAKREVSVRFVLYEDLEKEPPCAGPDYQPPAGAS